MIVSVTVAIAVVQLARQNSQFGDPMTFYPAGFRFWSFARPPNAPPSLKLKFHSARHDTTQCETLSSPCIVAKEDLLCTTSLVSKATSNMSKARLVVRACLERARNNKCENFAKYYSLIILDCIYITLKFCRFCCSRKTLSTRFM